MSSQSQPLFFFHFLGICEIKSAWGSSLPHLGKGIEGGLPQHQPTSVSEPTATLDTSYLPGLPPSQNMQVDEGFLIRVMNPRSFWDPSTCPGHQITPKKMLGPIWQVQTLFYPLALPGHPPCPPQTFAGTLNFLCELPWEPCSWTHNVGHPAPLRPMKLGVLWELDLYSLLYLLD